MSSKAPVRLKEEQMEEASALDRQCLGRESPDSPPEGIERSELWSSSVEDGYSSSEDDGVHSVSSQSTLPSGSAASSPARASSAAVDKQALTPTRHGVPCNAEAGGSTRAKRRLKLQECDDSEIAGASHKRRFLGAPPLNDYSTGTLRRTRDGSVPIRPTSELASRLLLVDRPSAPCATASHKIDTAVERGWKGPHMPSVESKVRSMLAEELEVSRVMCRVKGLNKLPLNKLKAALKDNTAVNMVSAETLPLMSRACEVFIKVLVMRSIEESLAQNQTSHKQSETAQVHVSHRHVEFAMLHSMMNVIAERGDSLSSQEGDFKDEDDEDEDDDDRRQQHAMVNKDDKAKALSKATDSTTQGNSEGMSVDVPDPTTATEIDAPLQENNDHVQDQDCLVHVDDDGGVDYILPAYYAPIVSLGAYMMPPTLIKQSSFKFSDLQSDLASDVWSGFAPQRSGETTPTPQCDAPGVSAAGHHKDCLEPLDCLREGDNAGLGEFEGPY